MRKRRTPYCNRGSGTAAAARWIIGAGELNCARTPGSIVKDVAVHPRGRRRGVGRALMLTVFAALRARDADFVGLKVREDNAAAISLYESLDMRVIERVPA
jgi:GNAT superfamily N-acetyltransferase